jgi:23S rRNA (cytidine1920-2'-O)/16S rRNA (cytidine1409-2'-O)-methyltransferase
VVAVDVGYGQLDAGLRSDPRVLVIERTNVRHMEASAVPGPIGLVTIDVSFISATLLLPRLPELAPGADVVVLVKPQFEVGRSQVEKGGVVRDEALRVAAADRVRGCAESLGYREEGRVDSRIPGPKGNREIFLWLQPAVSPRGRSITY